MLNQLTSLYKSIFAQVERLLEPWLLPSLARFVFAAVLFTYFYQSGLSKIDFGNGILGFLKPTANGFVQIFPKVAEAVFYDISQASFFHKLVIVLGGWSEILLPLMIVLGLLTRLASVGMIGFVVVQSLTDLYGHGGIAHKETLGVWFDKISDAAILDQRAFWMLLFVVLIVRGAGPISVDAILGLNRKNDDA
ncbi:DoxX family protein [Cognatishimia sp.]|uniref:DoxX family protein n=1 Tax=Cognatishimia sp. TaxID=2211648 RepID=UPI003518EC14